MELVPIWKKTISNCLKSLIAMISGSKYLTMHSRDDRWLWAQLTPSSSSPSSRWRGITVTISISHRNAVSGGVKPGGSGKAIVLKTPKIRKSRRGMKSEELVQSYRELALRVTISESGSHACLQLLCRLKPPFLAFFFFFFFFFFLLCQLAILL